MTGVNMATIDSSHPQELHKSDAPVEDADGWIMVGPGLWSPGPRAIAAFIEYQKLNTERLTDELERLKLRIEADLPPTASEIDQGI